ncbi:unnamed protein product [Hydatigera taeniaeformis]|uniref:DUF5727 domain-containing protein n=1 Tax=Hydatigena taeniaeformis TaxID=6205 RepID=A0A0R3WYU9_HYDTA|nr:unnamed protein product [Hydatigera taeniaeformis]
MVRNGNSDLVKFVATFSRNGEEEYTNFQWYGPINTLVVTVDWTQGGESMTALRRQAYFPFFFIIFLFSTAIPSPVALHVERVANPVQCTWVCEPPKQLQTRRSNESIALV